MIFSEQAEQIGELLKRQSGTVSVAESSTGGLIAANLLSVAGASRYFMGGSVIYTLPSRRAFLDLDREKLKTLKPLTEEMVLAFAAAAREKLDTTWGIAELGAAGPAGTAYGHPPGISVVGVWGPRSGAITIETHDSNRVQNMQAFTAAALDHFHKMITDT